MTKPKRMVWKTVQRKVSDLTPHPKNPRTMTDDQNTKLQDSLEKFDLVATPVINKDNVLLGGHQRCRLLIAQGRGDEMIDVRIPTAKLNEKDAEELLLRLNRNHGSWDEDALANHWGAEDLKEIGFSDWEVGIWDSNFEDVANTEPHTEGIFVTVKVKCPSDVVGDVKELIEAAVSGRTDCEIS